MKLYKLGLEDDLVESLALDWNDECQGDEINEFQNEKESIVLDENKFISLGIWCQLIKEKFKQFVRLAGKDIEDS